jgi:hypothetical protein
MAVKSRIGKSGKDAITEFLEELEAFRTQPRVVVLVSHGFVELLVNALVDKRCKQGKRINSNSRDFAHSGKLIILHEIGVLSDERYKCLDAFRNLRNKAAHDPVFRLSKTDLQVIKQDTGFDQPEEIHDICQALVADLWNEHADVFGNIFAPTMIARSSAGSGRKRPGSA